MEDERFRRVAKALADPRRFEILRTISEHGELSCGTIAGRFPVGQSTVSHHLRLLEDSQLLSVRREGQHGYFSARPEVLEEYVKDLQVRLMSPKS